MATPLQLIQWMCDQWGEDPDADICRHPLEYAERYDEAQAAWDACPYGDWMFYGLGLYAGEPESDERAKYVLMLTEALRGIVGWATDVVNTTEFIDIVERWCKNRTPSVEEIYEEGLRLVPLHDDPDEPRLEYRYWCLYSAITETQALAADAGRNIAQDYRELHTTLDGQDSRISRAQLADLARKHYPEVPDIGYQ